MRDCDNAEMRDALPDLMHGTLEPGRAAVLRAHLDDCDACRRELQLLRQVRDAAPAPAVRVDRIVASLPAYRLRPAWRRAAGHPWLRVAAAVVLVAGGATALLRRAPTAVEPVAVDTLAAPLAVQSGAGELSLGETFVGVSDSALAALVESIGDLDGMLSEEPERIAVPLVATEGS